MVKLLMSWDIKPGHESEYFEFVVQEFGPGLLKMGVRPTDAWYTAWGDGPQILTGGVADDMEAMDRVLHSDEWRDLKKKLLTFVTNYEQKVIRASGTFQL
jgi:hypothetical protein